MSFAWPQLLWLLLAPVALLAWEIAHRRRTGSGPAHPKILRAEAGAHQLALSAKPPSGGSRGARPWLCAGIALAIVAVARPQWGRIEEPVFDQSREILLAIDLSRSMLTPDVKPSRLDRAKLLIMSLLEKLAGERVGLAVFSGTAFLQSPLSADYEILREFLPSLGPDFLPEGGTNYRALIDTSLDAFGSSGSADRFMIVLSDGEATDDEWKARAEKLKAKGIRVIGLGIGTAAGAMIPDGSGGYVKDERGAVVLSKLESSTLQELARATGGVYRDASTWVDLAALLKETIEAGQKGQFLETNTIRLVERYQWPLGFALWCLVVSLCYEFPIRPRPRELKLTRSAGAASKARPNPAGIVGAMLLLLSFAPTPPVQAAASLAHPPKSAPKTTTENPAPAPSASLTRTVGRLSTTRTPTARDWAELGRETVTWGSRLQSEQQMVPEGPVRDALEAVDLGSNLDSKTADWAKLKEELEALLKKPDDKQDEKKDQQDQDEQQKKEQKEQNQKQDQKQSKDKKQSDEEQSQEDKKNSDPDQQNQPQDSKTKPPEDQPKPGESAFGDMKEKSEPPPPPQDTQQVGGAEKKEPPPEAADPSLALPLQKLDQLRNQDSPARLFELMEGEKKPGQKKSGKDW
ncbi:MAG: hypothetical protein RIQ93_581 [Verrucomicrobiota bacterium]|jgi:Ca-activated chloride channel family protein